MSTVSLQLGQQSNSGLQRDGAERVAGDAYQAYSLLPTFKTDLKRRKTID